MAEIVMFELAATGYGSSRKPRVSSSENSKERTISQTRAVGLLSKDHWISDSESQECQRCQKEFDLFTRKHHCRLCGALLCAGCCPNWRCPPLNQPAPLRTCFWCFFRLRPHNNMQSLSSLSLSATISVRGQACDKAGSVFARVCLMLDPWCVVRMLSVCREWALRARSDEVWRILFKRYSMEKMHIGRISRIQDRWFALFAKHVGPKISERLMLRDACLERPWFQAVDVDPWGPVRVPLATVRHSIPRPFDTPYKRVRNEESGPWNVLSTPSRTMSVPAARTTSRAQAFDPFIPISPPSSSSDSVSSSFSSLAPPSSFRQPWEFSLVCLGPSGVGKSCLLYRLKTGVYRELERTVGACFITHTMTVKFRKPCQPKQQQLARVSFWDMGAFPFPSFASMYTRTADGVLFFLDLSRACAWRDFLALQHLHKNSVVRTQSTREPRVDHLVLTKADLSFCWDEKTSTAAREWAISENMHVVESSAKHGVNVAAMFERVVAPLIACAVTNFSSVPVNNDEDSMPSRNHNTRRDSVQSSRAEELGDARRTSSRTDERTHEPSPSPSPS